MLFQEWLLIYLFAWVGVAIGVFLSYKYILRKLASSNSKNRKTYQKANRNMRSWHIWLGVVLIVLGFVHGLVSGEAILSLNWGTALFLVSILLGLNYVFRKLFSRPGLWIEIHRVLTILFLILTIIHVVDVGGPRILVEAKRIGEYQEISMSEPSASESIPETKPAEETTNTEPLETPEETTVSEDVISEINENYFGATLKDGIYTGIGTGYRPGLTVEVTVKDNLVTNIQILSHNEQNSRYYDRAFQKVPSEVVDAQSLDVDTVTGATKSSIGIIEAVRNALNNAVVDGDIS